MQPRSLDSTVSNSRFVAIFGNYDFKPDNAVLQFSYVDSNYDDYTTKNVRRSFQKQSAFLPALKSSAKTAYVALRLIGRAIYGSFKNSTTLIQNKLAAYIAIRLLQVSFGTLISPFNYKCGSYLIEEASVNLNVYKKISSHIINELEKK